jgi:hypothetical protein
MIIPLENLRGQGSIGRLRHVFEEELSEKNAIHARYAHPRCFRPGTGYRGK